MRTDLHADDLGATANVNRNILSAWSAGALSSVSVIANGDALEAAAEAVNQDPARPLRIIVHLNLSEGRPLAGPAKLPMLVDSRGQFYMGFVGLWKRWLLLNAKQRLTFLQQIELELSAQIQNVSKCFSPRPVMGVDGHIHIQMLPFIFPVAARLAAEHKLREIRITREQFHFSLAESIRFGYLANIVKHFLLNRLAARAASIAKANKLASPDRVAGVLYSGCMTLQTAAAAVAVGQRRNLQWLELIFHPGRASEEEIGRWAGLPAVGTFYRNPDRDKELNELLAIARKSSGA